VSGSILLSTVSNFLDFFKMEAGKALDIVRTEVDVQVPPVEGSTVMLHSPCYEFPEGSTELLHSPCDELVLSSSRCCLFPECRAVPGAFDRMWIALQPTVLAPPSHVQRERTSLIFLLRLAGAGVRCPLHHRRHDRQGVGGRAAVPLH
jgi:hypothetical protein